MAIVNFSEFAKADLKSIFAYLAENDVDSADKLVDELLEKFKLLAENSGLGRKRDEFIVNLRSFPYKRYIIFYFPIENGVEIFRVIHSSRDIETLFTDYFEGLEE
jgi:toxin ParE1/3/4